MLDIILCLVFYFSPVHCLKENKVMALFFCLRSFLEQRLLALEARYGKELQGLESEKQQLQELLERQSRLVSQLQGELGSTTLNSTSLQKQQAVLTDTVQQLLAMVNHCNGKAEGLIVFEIENCTIVSKYTFNVRQMFSGYKRDQGSRLIHSAKNNFYMNVYIAIT